VVNGLINGVKFIREVFIYFKESQGRLVSNIKLKGCLCYLKRPQGKLVYFSLNKFDISSLIFL
jgi:hypothetical protein